MAIFRYFYHSKKCCIPQGKFRFCDLPAADFVPLLAQRGVLEPPFSFRLGEKKTAVHGQKKSRLVQTYTKCLSVSACISVSLYPAIQALTQQPSRAFRFAKRSCGAVGRGLFPLRVGYPKGRAAARPFESFQGGPGGNRNPPGISFWTGCGPFFFLKEKWGGTFPCRSAAQMF